MIDRIGTQLRPVITKKEDDSKESHQGQHKDQGEQGKTPSEESHPEMPLPLLKSMVEKLNDHPYYKEKQFAFEVIFGTTSMAYEEKKMVRPKVMVRIFHQKSQQTIQKLSSEQTEKLYIALEKGNIIFKGNLVDLKW